MAAETALKRQENGATPAEMTRERRGYVPPVDIIETEAELQVIADMPGVKAENVNINYERGLLSIHGRVEPRINEQEACFLLREYGIGDYYRSFQIGEGIDADKIAAELKNGVMVLHLPKTPTARKRRIEVKGE